MYYKRTLGFFIACLPFIYAATNENKRSQSDTSNLIDSKNVPWQIIKSLNGFQNLKKTFPPLNLTRIKSFPSNPKSRSHFPSTKQDRRTRQNINKIDNTSILNNESYTIKTEFFSTALPTEPTRSTLHLANLENKPNYYKEIYSFEDPFGVSSMLQQETFNKLLSTDSSSFVNGQNIESSSFRKFYLDSLKSFNKNNTTEVPQNEDKLRRVTHEKDVDFNPMELNKNVPKTSDDSLKNSKTDLFSTMPLPIYEEISGALHIDTSIDDIEKEFLNIKVTENNDQYIPSVNTTHKNFLDPNLPSSSRSQRDKTGLHQISNVSIMIPVTENSDDVFFGNSSILDSELGVDWSNITDLLKFIAGYEDMPIDEPNVIPTSTKTSYTTYDQTSPLLDLGTETPAANMGIMYNSTAISEIDKNIPDITSTNQSSKNSTNTSQLDPRNKSSFMTSSTKPTLLSSHVRAVRLRQANSDASQVFSRNISQKLKNVGKNSDSENLYYSLFGYNDARKGGERNFSVGSESLSVEEHNKMVLDAQAERMLLVMNKDADPCTDFYEYACGRWAEVYPLEDKALDNTFDRLREGLDEVLKSLLDAPWTSKESKATTAAKTLYRGCLNMKNIETLGTNPLLDLLKELGGWPVLEGIAWNEEAFDWVEVMAKLRTYNNDVLLAEWVAADITNSSQHIIQIDQPELGLPSREYFLSPGDEQYRKAYLDLMLKSCELLGSEPITAITDMLDVINFEKELARILVPTEERRNLSAVHKRFTQDELQKEIPEINWKFYLGIVVGDVSIPTQDVIVFSLEYIKKLVFLISVTEKRTVSNYLFWRFVKNRISNLGEVALDAKQDFIQTLFGSKSRPERWLACVSYVNGNMGYVVGALFVKQYYPASSKNDSEEIIRLIRESFTEALSEAEWMHERTREIAIEKVLSMVWNVGYPEYILNDTYMDSIYSKLNFNESNHFWNVIQMLQFHATTTHQLLQQTVNRTEWTTTPAVVNAYYSRSKNMIMFPAGILQPPFYHPAFPRCLNFGGVGVVIGHEISHGFDNRGRQFDKDGNLHQWWAKEDVSQFYDRATCMLVQYAEYEVPSVGLQIKSVNTLSENIADNAGLKIAYRAYQRWKTSNIEDVSLPNLTLTHDQLFFLNFGQIWCEVNSPEAMLTKVRGGQHSPNKFRVIGTLSNSDEFATAFNCPKGSPMNPSEKCNVW